MQIPQSVKAIIFDMDDTLYSELDYVRSGYRAIASRLARPDWPAERIYDLMWHTFENGPRDRVFNIVLEKLGEADNPQVIAELVGQYRCHRPTLQLADSVKQLLSDLKPRYNLGLITDGFLPAQRLKIEALGIVENFDRIICTEELGREFWKPSTRAYKMMEQAFGVSGSQCMYIADNPGKDFVAPNKLNWHTIQVIRPDRVHSDRATALNGAAEAVIQDITDLTFSL